MNIDIPVSGGSLYGYGFDVELSLDTLHFVYGYGYGYSEGTGSLDDSYPTYFDVFAIEGDLYGYGADVSIGYNYGWGYERTTFIQGDGTETVQVTATVTDKGGVPAESGIPVLFTGSPGVSFIDSMVHTDMNGQAVTRVSFDSSVERNLDIFGSEGESGERARYISNFSTGYMTIEATIPKCMVAQDWNVKIAVESTNNYGESEFQYINIPVVGINSF